MAKILSYEDALTWRGVTCRGGKSLVVANGCFDLLHSGHVRYLTWAKEQGDSLLVAINSDRSVRGLKGAGRPIMPHSQRLELVAALGCVDTVVGFDENDVAEILQSLKPEVFVKGGDYDLHTLRPDEREVVESYGGTIRFGPWEREWSTTVVIDRIDQSRMAAAAQDAPLPIETLFLDRDGVLNRECGHVVSPDQLEVFPWVPDCVAKLNECGIECIVITNQSGLARAVLDDSGLNAIHDKLNRAIESAGGRLKATYVSPWHPGPLEGGRSKFIFNSQERKPAPGLIFKAVRDHGLELAACACVGDSLADLEAANAAGLRFFAVESPKSIELPPQTKLFSDFAAVVDDILGSNSRQSA